MNNIQKRLLLFLFGCITFRLLLVIITKKATITNLKYMGYSALLPAIGFLFIYFNGLRKTGGETFGENIWWNNLRPLHSLLYLLFAYNAIYAKQNAWKYLLVDVIIGLFSFLVFHYRSGNFKQLI